MRRLKTGRRPPIYPKTPGHLPCSSLTHPLPLPSRRPSVSFGGFGLRKPCAEPTCPNLTRRTYCAAHQRAYNRHYKQTHPRPVYEHSRWRRVRQHYLAEHYRCVGCGAGASVVDHIVPVKSGGGFWNEAKWQALCWACHNRKTAEERR